MIEQITIKNFKSFKDVTLRLGPLNIFIGANASGKSNFFDALRVLQGIGYGFTLSEILDGKPKSATSEVWEGIRGGSQGIGFAFENGNKPTLFQVAGKLPDKGETRFEFRISFSPGEGRFCEESLFVSGSIVYDCALARDSQDFIVRKSAISRGTRRAIARRWIRLPSRGRTRSRAGMRSTNRISSTSRKGTRCSRLAAIDILSAQIRMPAGRNTCVSR